MRKLLSANFSRLWKSKIFWVLESFCFGFGVFVYTLVAINTRNIGQGWLEYEAHAYFYIQILYIAVIIAIFACFFIGTDHSDGTIRNKMIVGHSRETIYLSFLLPVLTASFFFALAYFLAVLLIGIPFSGVEVLTCVEAQLWRLLGFGLAITEYASLFTLLSMSDSNKARNVVISLLVAGIVVLSGMYAYGKLSQPEYIPIVSYQENGGYLIEDGALNPEYLTGTIRTVYQWITMIIPSGAVMLSLDKNLAFDWRNPICAVILTVLLTTIGIAIFRKKDIK